MKDVNVPVNHLSVGAKVLCFRKDSQFEPWRELWKSPATTSLGKIIKYNEKSNTYSVKITDWGPLFSTIEEFPPTHLHIWGYYSPQNQWGF